MREAADAGSSPNRKGNLRRLLLVWPVAFVSAGLALAVAFVAAPSEAGSQTLGVSQGSITPYPYADVTEGPWPGYSQVVDNATKGRFRAPGWGEHSGDWQTFGVDYAEASGDVAPARFKVNIPATGYYSVYAWWPAREGNN